MEPYKGDSTLGKRIEQLQITLSTVAKMLERMWTNQKRQYQHHKATHEFWVGDLVLLNYRVIRLKSLWSVLVENQISSKTKCCNIGDHKAKHPLEDWTIQPSAIGRATRFINHPENLTDVDISIRHDMTLDIQKSPGVWVDTRYNHEM